MNPKFGSFRGDFFADPRIRGTFLELKTPDGKETFHADPVGTCLDRKGYPGLEMVVIQGHVSPPEILWNAGHPLFRVLGIDHRTKRKKKLTVLWLEYQKRSSDEM